MSDSQDAPSVPRPRRLNIRDIAARTGLSTGTISRAINGKSRISEQTRARVLATLQEVGHVPSGLAIGLRTGRTGLLGLMIGEPRDPTALAAMQGALEAAAPTGYGVIVYMTSQKREHEKIYSQALARGWIDGALLLWPTSADEPFVRRLHESGMPLVLIEPEVPMPGVPSVYADAYSDGYRSTRYLLELGHRRIGLCAAAPLCGIESRYLDGYRAALAEVGVPVEPGFCLSAGVSFEVGYETAMRWLQLSDPPTGICCHSDMAAMGAIAAARESGVAVPDQLSVIGYDDTQMARWIKPSLTALRERRFGEAQAACGLLLELINSVGPPTEPLLIQTDLVVRQSSGTAPSA